MALTYTCPTCSTSFDCHLSSGKIRYMDGNKFFDLDSELEDCGRCQTKIKEAQEEAREKIRSSLHEEKTL